MSKKTKESTVGTDSANPNKAQFTEIISQIQKAKQRAFQQVNETLVQLYWDIGEYIAQQVKVQSWGKSTVEQLASFIQQHEPNNNGFSARNIWRMKQFYETYTNLPKLSTLRTVLPWSHNRRIMTLKTAEEQEFYLILCKQKKYSFRELERLIKTGTFERTMLADQKLATVGRELPQAINGILLFREKGDEVVKYALNRSLSPTVIADYETKLIPKELLRKKLNEFYALLEGGK